jgi:hypothetical protein
MSTARRNDVLLFISITVLVVLARTIIYFAVRYAAFHWQSGYLYDQNYNSIAPSHVFQYSRNVIHDAPAVAEAMVGAVSLLMLYRLKLPALAQAFLLMFGLIDIFAFVQHCFMMPISQYLVFHYQMSRNFGPPSFLRIIGYLFVGVGCWLLTVFIASRLIRKLDLRIHYFMLTASAFALIGCFEPLMYLRNFDNDLSSHRNSIQIPNSAVMYNTQEVEMVAITLLLIPVGILVIDYLSKRNRAGGQTILTNNRMPIYAAGLAAILIFCFQSQIQRALGVY